MPDYASSIIRRTLPEITFKQLQSLWQQVAKQIGAGVVLLTEEILLSAEVVERETPESLTDTGCFVVLVSKQFSALLTATGSERSVSASDPLYPSLQAQPQTREVGLTFNPVAIASFLTQLTQQIQHPAAIRSLEQARKTIQPNDAIFQSEFTLSLIEVLTANSNPASVPESVYSYVSVCQPVEAALRQQVEQERLLNQVTTQMRQSLELPVILETAIKQVRECLQVDRLVIYQFSSPSQPEIRIQKSKNLLSAAFQEHLSERSSQGYGYVTYEARAFDNIPSVLHWGEEKHCFVDVADYREKYRKGFTQAVADIETRYVLTPCFVALMRRSQIRAKLVVPIIVQEQLWGLLIAHQCYEPRQWQESEKTFLQSIGEHLAIAIYQAQLYGELQQQKQTLEKRVIERTQELHDALLVAEAASRFKSEFLAMMSHELRTPLTCVIGLSSTLLRWPLGELSQKQQNYLQTIHDSGQHLLELINDILDLSQVEAGKAVLNLSEFSLAKLAHQSLQMLKEKSLISGVDLVMELKIEPTRDRFIADPRRVKQILLNLLSNAVKFTLKGGQVVLRIWLENQNAILQVEDTGIGIPKDQQSLLFEKFQQLDSAYHRKYEGIGLGLALTKKLVELHSGWIEVESTVGVGSTFTVCLPAQVFPLTETSVPLTNNHPVAACTGQIVLVENHEEVATLICDILTAAGYQVVWLLESSTAVEHIKLLQPSVLIIDLNLPGREGYEIIHCLRKTSVTQQIKALVLTTTEVSNQQDYLISIEADDYLIQPLKPEQLLHKVMTLITH
jgi:two-component system sensor histidine kinase/response regulator